MIRATIEKAKAAKQACTDMAVGALGDHGTHVYRKHIETHWALYETARASGSQNCFQIMERLIFVLDMAAEDVRAVRRYKAQFRAILAQVIQVTPSLLLLFC